MSKIIEADSESEEQDDVMKVNQEQLFVSKPRNIMRNQTVGVDA